MTEGAGDREARAGGASGVAKLLARLAVSALLLWVVLLVVDAGRVFGRLGDVRAGWVAVALAISVGQVALLAWRWRFTAGRLGIELPFRTALAEYYLGVLINQVLPGGVVGDVSRAWRHTRRAETGRRPAVLAVIFERATAQVLMTTTAIACLFALPWANAAVRVGACLAVAASSFAVARAWLARPDDGTRPLRSEARRALVADGVWRPQLLTAAVVVASYVAVYLAAAGAIGIETSLPAMAVLVPPVLMTMLVPVTIAGWGIREAAAAALWGFVGMTPEDGAAISVAYGLLVLASSLPGALVLLSAALGSRGRTARPPPA